jgi:protein TonB
VRGSAAILVIAAHIAVIYAVAISIGVIETPNIVTVTKAVVLPPKDVPLPPSDPVAKPSYKPIVDDMPPPVVDVERDPGPGAINLVPRREVEPDSTVSGPGSGPVIETNISVTRRVDPVYPPSEIRLEHEGVVRLRILVDERGRAREVQVAKSSGFDRLDDSAVTAVRRWQFKPATRAAGAVAAWTEVNVVFRLDR